LSSRSALAVFVVMLLVAFVALLAIGRYRWFTHDEWDFLAGRNGGDIESLLIPHNEHWSTLPIVIYRVLFRFVGLRSYLPYQAVLVLFHLTTAALLRVVMRRAGVGPWIATVAALVIVFFGTGYQNIIWAFQIGFVGSLVFGLTHLLLADHDGPINRWDGLGLIAGLAGLLCSSVALTMVAVVGFAALLRRGWRAALLHTAPLALVYAIWLSVFEDRRTAQGDGYPHHDLSSPGQVARFMATGIRAAFDAIGQLSGVAWALGILLVIGLPLAWLRIDRADRRRRLAMPVALLAGAFLSICITGIARAAAFGTDFARTGRYLYLFAAMVLPALAVAADGLARRWRVLGPVVVAVLIIGIPGNVDALLQRRRSEQHLQAEYRRLILTLPRLRIAREVPRSTRPEQELAKPLTIGWLLDGVASGRIPKPARKRPVDAATATLSLALNQQPDAFGAKVCRNATTPRTLEIAPGRAIRIYGRVRVVYVTANGVRSRPVTFDPDQALVTEKGIAHRGPRLVALTGPLMLALESEDAHTPVALCV
jgi:hypothetical protein